MSHDMPETAPGGGIGRHELIEVSFKPATGGMISETRHKMGGGKFGPDYKHDTAVHGSLGHAVRHLKAAFGKASGKKDASMKKSDRSASMKKG